MEALAGLLVASFAAATLLPLPSEAALYAYLRLHPESTALAIAVATLGNTAGGMTSYALGRVFPERGANRRYIQLVKRYGAPATFLAWLPIVGDALCVAAGWLRIGWLPVLLFMAAGRCARYVVVSLLA
jgi:membrane protein YqaA with SNARE-associated domain